MIPILYEKTETTFTSNGIGRLVDCIRCIVTEERNGIYECEFDYPITGKLYPEIVEGRIIAAAHDDSGDVQPFDIYHRTAPINGIVTFYAQHVSYRLNGIVVQPFTASGVSAALAGLKTNSIQTNSFTFTTDKTTAGDYTITVPASCRAMLGGAEGSLLDVFGSGEYLFDKFSVYLYAHRGTDTDVEIRYGKNLQDLENDYDYGSVYNGVVPFWRGLNDSNVEEVVTLPELTIIGSGSSYTGRDIVVPLDMSGNFTAKPTEAELRSLATSSLENAAPWNPSQNIVVSFVQLWQTAEYASVAPLQTVKLCDTVTVIYPELGITGIRLKVVRVVFNTLLDRYDEIELGSSATTYAAVLMSSTEKQISLIEDGLALIQDKAVQAIADADTAHTAALEAQTSASDAQSAAQSAVTAAGEATDAAVAAQTKAEEAEASATTAANSALSASISANSALGQLSEVEKVVDVLNWAAKHGQYGVTEDTEVIPGKYYFTRSGTGTAEDPYVYTVISEPTGNPHTQGYYELQSVDEAISNYVATHLALTNDGLFLQTDGSGTKIQIASNAIYLYDEYGTIIATYSDDITLGNAADTHITLSTANGLGFYQGVEDPNDPSVNRVAYIDQNKLYITQAEITSNLRIGNFVWTVQSPTRISLIYSP